MGEPANVIYIDEWRRRNGRMPEARNRPIRVPASPVSIQRSKSRSEPKAERGGLRQGAALVLAFMIVCVGTWLMGSHMLAHARQQACLEIGHASCGSNGTVSAARRG
jgi:hypothetical protein